MIERLYDKGTMKTKPTHISASRSKANLIVEWDDGHRSEYPLSGLRASCPCAECQGTHSDPSSTDLFELPILSAQASNLDKIERVGNYAVQFLWEDGHHYGIYTWDYLRQLCPCGEHSKEGKSAEPSTR